MSGITGKDILKYALVAFSFSIPYLSCKRISDLQKNPNAATAAPPSVIFTGVLQDMFFLPWSDAQRSSQFYCETASYYGEQSYDFGAATYYYYTIRNIDRMIIEANRIQDDALRPYYALGHFLKAFFYINMTEQVGDVPMSQAMMAEKGIYQPIYDTQKSIFIQCLKWLEMANDTLETLSSTNYYGVEGDIFFGGDLSKWRRLVNSFRLRVLIGLSKRANDPDLAVKKQFAEILGDPNHYPIMESNLDNMQITYDANSVDNYYPAFSDNPLGVAKRRPLGATFINLLKDLHDPRLFKVAMPAAQKSGPDTGETVFDTYRGAPTGVLQVRLSDSVNAGYYSLADYEYWFSSKTGVPTIQLGVCEVDFSLAEGINRGWAGEGKADLARDYYEKGIKESMAVYGIDSSEIESYVHRPAIQYKGNNVEGLEQILEQKYIAFFQNSGWEPFYNYRRTGVPEFSTGPSNKNNGLIPKRWYYPQSDYFDNLTNLRTALASQYGGADDLNAVMWMLK